MLLAVDRFLEDVNAEKVTRALAHEATWHLHLALAGVVPGDHRDWLPPTEQGYVVRLVIGADDGGARRYDVRLQWDGSATSARAALDSVGLAVSSV